MSRAAENDCDRDRPAPRTKRVAIDSERERLARTAERKRWLWILCAGPLCYVVLRVTAPWIDEPSHSLLAKTTWALYGLALAVMVIRDLRNARRDEDRRWAWRAAAGLVLGAGIVASMLLEGPLQPLIQAVAWTLYGLALAACVFRDLRNARPRY